MEKKPYIDISQLNEIGITEEQWRAWYGSNTTKSIMVYLAKEIDRTNVYLGSGGTVYDTQDKTAIMTAREVGFNRGLMKALEVFGHTE